MAMKGSDAFPKALALLDLTIRLFSEREVVSIFFSPSKLGKTRPESKRISQIFSADVEPMKTDMFLFWHLEVESRRLALELATSRRRWGKDMRHYSRKNKDSQKLWPPSWCELQKGVFHQTQNCKNETNEQACSNYKKNNKKKKKTKIQDLCLFLTRFSLSS